MAVVRTGQSTELERMHRAGVSFWALEGGQPQDRQEWLHWMGNGLYKLHSPTGNHESKV